MLETPIYYLLAELNTLMTASLRLALACWLLLLSSLLAACWQPRWAALQPYVWAWLSCLALLALLPAAVLTGLFHSNNPFVAQGLKTSIVLLGWGVSCLILSLGAARLHKKRPDWQSLRLPLLGIWLGLQAAGGWWFFQLPAFSRSDKTLFSVVLSLPIMAVMLYFPALLTGLGQYMRPFVHTAWALSLLLALGVHHFWLFPFLAGIPTQGEFFPYINLYDWFLSGFVILYLGNVYIDFWLKPEKNALRLSWNTLFCAWAVLLQWLNTNIFDTLAL